MENLRTHLDKIRSDAAECALLSKLAGDGKGEMFAKAGEHLNSLAFELEKAIATNNLGAGAGSRSDDRHVTPAEVREEAVANNDNIDAARRTARPRRILAWSLAFILAGIAGIFWSSEPAQKYWYSYASQSKQETLPAQQDQAAQAMAALLSGEQAERKKLMERVGALTARVDSLITSMDELKTARAETTGRSRKDSIGAAEEKPIVPETKPSASEEKSAREGKNLTSPAESPSAAKPSEGAPEQAVGTIPIPPRRAELDSRRSTNGPSGCTQFRSYDATSETYMTLDGRRRPCRP